MNNFLISKLWDFIILDGIATEEELKLVTNIVGYSEQCLNMVIEVRTEYRNYTQCITLEPEFYEAIPELDDYYGLND